MVMCASSDCLGTPGRRGGGGGGGGGGGEEEEEEEEEKRRRRSRRQEWLIQCGNTKYVLKDYIEVCKLPKWLWIQYT